MWYPNLYFNRLPESHAFVALQNRRDRSQRCTLKRVHIHLSDLDPRSLLCFARSLTSPDPDSLPNVEDEDVIAVKVRPQDGFSVFDEIKS